MPTRPSCGGESGGFEENPKTLMILFPDNSSHSPDGLGDAPRTTSHIRYRAKSAMERPRSNTGTNLKN